MFGACSYLVLVLSVEQFPQRQSPGVCWKPDPTSRLITGSQEQNRNCLKAAPRVQAHPVNQSWKLAPPFISVLNASPRDETHSLYINVNKVSGRGKYRQLPFPGSARLFLNIQHYYFS